MGARHVPPAAAGYPGCPSEGDIWVCKLGWWTGAPWDVLAYARDHSTYPGDSTLEQLYDATEFEAYQQLGTATVLDAAQECMPPLSCPSALASAVRRCCTNSATPGDESGAGTGRDMAIGASLASVATGRTATR